MRFGGGVGGIYTKLNVGVEENKQSRIVLGC